MATSAYETAENVKFNGTTTQAVVLKDVANIKSLIVTEKHSDLDIALLDRLIAAYGGVTPLAGPTEGKLTANFNGAVVGGNATGLSATAVATAAYATVDVGGAKVGGTATGLSSAAGTAGSQTANFQPGVVGGDATGLTATVAATAGTQTINVGGTTVGGDPTSLVGGTTYTATITVDGVGKAISILGLTASTFTTLLAELNTDLAGAATASLSGGNILITSATTGASSSVAITAGTLFASPLAGFVSVAAAIAGVAAVVTTYTATITVDGVAKSISIVGSNALTFTNLLTELNTDLAGAGTASISGGDIKITSATTGVLSKVVITAGSTLFAALTGFVGLFPSADGDGTTRSYSALVVIDGVVKPVLFTGLQGNTYTNLLSQINTDIGGAGTAALSGGNVRITSATSGLASSVVVYDAGLFASLTGFASITSTAGTAPTVYTATITVDGVDKAIAVQGDAAQTYTTLVSEINTDLGASATAAITGGNIVITSATTGVASTVTAVDGTLFKRVTAFAGFKAPQPGAADLLAVLQRDRTPAGGKYSELFNIEYVGDKPAVLPNTPHTTDFIYYDGAAWRYLDNDAAV